MTVAIFTNTISAPPRQTLLDRLRYTRDKREARAAFIEVARDRGALWFKQHLVAAGVDSSRQMTLAYLKTAIAAENI